MQNRGVGQDTAERETDGSGVEAGDQTVLVAPEGSAVVAPVNVSTRCSGPVPQEEAARESPTSTQKVVTGHDTWALPKNPVPVPVTLPELGTGVGAGVGAVEAGPDTRTRDLFLPEVGRSPPYP